MFDNFKANISNMIERSRQKHEEQNRYYQSIYQKCINNDYIKITRENDLRDYYTCEKGDICYLDDRNVYVMHHQNTSTWRRYALDHSAKTIYERPKHFFYNSDDYDSCDHDFVYPPRRSVFKEISNKTPDEITELERNLINVKKSNNIWNTLIIGTIVLHILYQLIKLY